MGLPGNIPSEWTVLGGAGVYQDGSTLRGKVQLHSDADVNGG